MVIDQDRDDRDRPRPRLTETERLGLGTPLTVGNFHIAGGHLHFLLRNSFYWLHYALHHLVHQA